MFSLPHQILFGGGGRGMGERRGAYRGLVGKPEARRSFGRSVRRWENNVKMDLREGRRALGSYASENRYLVRHC